MTWYELWLFLHISAAIVWIGGAVAVQVFAALTKRAADPAQSAALGRNVSFLGSKVFLPAALLVGVTGIALVVEGNWDWGEPFVAFGLLGWAVVALTAFGYVSPSLGRAGRRMAEEGPSPALVAEIDRLVLLARALILVLFVVVFMMVAKLWT
jgi:uncharacterized membrane protein